MPRLDRIPAVHPGHSAPPRSARLAGAVLAVAALAAVPASAGLEVADGFRSGFDGRAAVGGLAVLPDGGLAMFDGMSVILYAPDGSPVRTALFIDDPVVFGTFLRLSPAGDALYFGVNYPSASTSIHSIYRIPLAEGTFAEEVDVLRFNYDLAFDGEGRGFISSSALGPQGIFLLDSDPGAPNDPVVVDIPGPSGPLAFRGGRLYYATADWSTTNRIVYFTEEQLEAGIGDGRAIPFSAAVDAGQVVAADLPGSYFNLVFAGDALLGSGAGRIEKIIPGGVPETLATVIPGPEGFPWASYIAFRPGRKTFEAGSGPEGGVLLASVSDFKTFNGLAVVTPALWFQRGRINPDEGTDISDTIALLSYLFLGGTGPDPVESGDLNDDGVLDVSDPVYLLMFLFGDGPEPPEPFHFRGPDPTP